MSEIFDQERLQSFVKKASYGKNLGRDKLFDISDLEQAEEMALGLFTEYVVHGQEAELKKARISAGYLTRSIDDKILGGMHNALRHGERIERIGSGVAGLTQDIAGIAARSIRDKIAADKAAEKEGSEYRVVGDNLLNRSTGDVIRGMFENGIISPGHAAALLTYFRLEEPKRETKQYEQLMKKVQNDLVTRLRTAEHADYIQLHSRGMAIIKSYVRRHQEEEIALILPDREDTHALNGALLRLYMLKDDELLSTLQPTRLHSNYENTVAPIDGFDD